VLSIAVKTHYQTTNRMVNVLCVPRGDGGSNPPTLLDQATAHWLCAYGSEMKVSQVAGQFDNRRMKRLVNLMLSAIKAIAQTAKKR
jgi:hypothetical protein